MTCDDDGSSDLFDGEEALELDGLPEDPRDVTEDHHVVGSGVGITSPDEMAVDALERTISHLTYRELHAFGAGFIPLFVGLVLGFDALVALAIPLTVAALGCVRCTPIVGGRVAQWAIKQPHYLLLGQLIGLLLGGTAVAIIRVVGFIAGVVA